jgi:transcription initiation factor TFIIIB Brf1 subunit/transcription initiation factor TFIIB
MIIFLKKMNLRLKLLKNIMNTEIWDLFNEINNSFNINGKDIDNKYSDSCNLKDNINKKTCFNCKQTDSLISECEMVVCTSCGAENEYIIDYQAEWRYYGSDDNKRSSDPNRCGIPSNPIIPDSSLSTVILGKGFEVFRKLNSWNGLSYKQRTLIAILNKIAIKANIDNVPQSIIDATMNMYKMISQDYIKRGASRESLIAACFFNALRDQGMIRSTDEIAKLFDIKAKKLSKGCNEFTELMFTKNREYVKNMKPIESKDLIERFCTLLEIDENYIKIAITAAAIIDKLGLCQENNPKSIAVGVIYLISQNYNLGFTKKEISEQCKTSEVTVTNTFVQMIKFKKYLLPKDVK